MRRNKGLIIFLTIISFIVSLAISGYTTYLSILQNWWFILIAVYFFFEAIFILVAVTRKNEYTSMKVFGIFEIVGVLVMMDYLLVMILWNDPGTMVYLNSYIVFGGAAFLKGLTTIISASANRKEYNPTLHGFRNNDLITFTYLLLIIELVIFKNIYPQTSYTDTLWVYIVEVLTNASLTVLAAFLALSTTIRSKVKEDLSPIGKIKHTIISAEPLFCPASLPELMRSRLIRSLSSRPSVRDRKGPASFMTGSIWKKPSRRGLNMRSASICREKNLRLTALQTDTGFFVP